MQQDSQEHVPSTPNKLKFIEIPYFEPMSRIDLDNPYYHLGHESITTNNLKIPWRILPMCALTAAFVSSPWYASVAFVDALHFSSSQITWMLFSVNMGYILGTSISTYCSLADVFQPQVFIFFLSLLISGINGCILVVHTFNAMIVLQTFLGIFLANVFPLVVKLAKSWYSQSTVALGMIMCAMTFAVSFPHLLASIGNVPLEVVVLINSTVAILGGIIGFFIPLGPLSRVTKFSFKGLFRVCFRYPLMMAIIADYAHIFELFTFWRFVKPMLEAKNPNASHTSLTTFFIILSGITNNLIASFLARFVTIDAHFAILNLFVSGMCCLLSPLFFLYAPYPLYVSFFIIWGIFVIGDASSILGLISHHAPPDLVGTAVLLALFISYALSAASLQLVQYIFSTAVEWTLFPLAAGPLIGIIVLCPLLPREWKKCCGLCISCFRKIVPRKSRKTSPKTTSGLESTETEMTTTTTTASCSSDVPNVSIELHHISDDNDENHIEVQCIVEKNSPIGDMNYQVGDMNYRHEQT